MDLSNVSRLCLSNQYNRMLLLRQARYVAGLFFYILIKKLCGYVVSLQEI